MENGKCSIAIKLNVGQCLYTQSVTYSTTYSHLTVGKMHNAEFCVVCWHAGAAVRISVTGQRADVPTCGLVKSHHLRLVNSQMLPLCKYVKNNCHPEGFCNL